MALKGFKLKYFQLLYIFPDYIITECALHFRKSQIAGFVIFSTSNYDKVRTKT